MEIFIKVYCVDFQLINPDGILFDVDSNRSSLFTNSSFFFYN